MPPTVGDHLRRIHLSCLDSLANEVRHGLLVKATYPGIGDIHPGEGREGHVQQLLFMGLRQAGYFTLAETSYFRGRSAGRQIDLGVWIPDVERRLFLEVKPCGPQMGDPQVRRDAKKLVDDNPPDPRDQLRGVLAYGFRDPVNRDDFPGKYERTGEELARLGFEQIGVARRSLEGGAYTYVQVGMWVIDG